jgi:hypothetical protein
MPGGGPRDLGRSRQHRLVTEASSECCQRLERSRRICARPGLFKEARELDRAADPRKKGTPRYIYFRRGLEGPIADLERRFHERDSENP